MVYKISGNWSKGLAFDLHTVVSVYLGIDDYGHSHFDNTRSEMGELVYQLKYRGDQTAVPKIINLLEKIKGVEKFDAIIPVPPSRSRSIQPVEEIAQALGKRHKVPVLVGYLVNKNHDQLKNITDPADREKALAESIVVSGTENISGKNILLLDDVYDSGTTLNACSRALMRGATIGKICVLTMTKTRSSQ